MAVLDGVWGRRREKVSEGTDTQNKRAEAERDE